MQTLKIKSRLHNCIFSCHQLQLPSQAMNFESQKITNHDLLNHLSKVLFPRRSSKMIDGRVQCNCPYLPTSGDLKTGDSLFCTTPPNPRMSTAHSPPRRPREQIALGHYMTSYIKYMESKMRFHHCNDELIFVID